MSEAPALTWASTRLLLKYLTRDEVELLKAGSGGFAEVRDAITEYPDKSPLYGLIQYRRKKVLLKYLPDGTSRLLQGMRNASDDMSSSRSTDNRIHSASCRTRPSDNREICSRYPHLHHSSYRTE